MKINIEFDLRIRSKWKSTIRSIYTKQWETVQLEFDADGSIRYTGSPIYHKNWYYALRYHFFDR